MKYSELPENNKFCVLAWRGAHIMPSGETVACCMQTYGHYDIRDYDVKQSLSQKTFGTIRDSAEWRRMRKDLIQGIETKPCESCWHNERKGFNSLRLEKNRTLRHLLNDIEINEDGSLADHKVSYWDIRDNNLCNMKCVMCGPGLSSLWNEEAFKHGTQRPVGNKAVIHVDDNSIESVEEILERHIEHAESFYFAGGEPLINDTHWKILDMLVERKMFHVTLFYNSNLLKLNYKGKDAIEYWKQFKEVHVGASIDAIGSRAEYSRAGTVWSAIDKNAKRMMQELPGSLGLSTTTNILTLGGLTDLFNWVGELGIHYGKFGYSNILVSPWFLNFNILPKDYRMRELDRIERFINSIDTKYQHHFKQRGWQKLQDALNDEVEDPAILAYRRWYFKHYCTRLDDVRGNSLIDACPELKPFWDSIDLKNCPEKPRGAFGGDE